MKAFANVQNPERCLVRLYTKYMALRPDDAPSSVFYLQPMKCPRPNCWYQSRPVGHNQLSKTVKRLCNKAGMTGYFTNHLLRRTCATRLYQQGADEQLIMSVTGHRSKDGVRMYKEVSHEQQEELNEMIQPTKRRRVETATASNDTSPPGPAGTNSSSTFSFINCSVTFHKD